MKTTLFAFIAAFILTLGSFLEADAQQRIVEKTFQADPSERIRMNLQFGENIVVRGWDRNEVSFKAIVEINNGILNDAFVANYKDDNTGIQIETDFDKEKLEDGRRPDCPQSRYNSYSWNNDSDTFVCSKITFEIFIPKNSDLQLETIAADIELYDLNGPIDAKSISGYVDLSWPETNGAEFSLETVTGEAYSDLTNLTFNNRKDHIPYVGYDLRGLIGSGGPPIRLESVSGNLFLRKTGG